MDWIEKNSELPKAGCAITTAGQLQANYVIHTIGCEVGVKQDEEELTTCIVNILDTAYYVGARSIAMPQIWRRFYEGYEENNSNLIKCMIQTCINWARTIDKRST